MLLPVLLNLCLAALKFVGGSLSDSVSVTADALNNLTDAVTSLLTMLGLKVASLIGGKKHENGHGRMEWIVAMIVSCAVILVGWETLQSAITAIREPESTTFHVLTLCVLVASIGVKLFLYGYNTKMSREKNSQALKAAAADCISDAVSTSLVTVSLLTDTLFHIRVDGWCGLLVALFIMYNGIKSFADTAHRIMGGNSDPEATEKLRQYVLAFHGGVFSDVPELQIHDYGYDRYGASMCVTARQDMDAEEAAEYAASLKSAIYRDFGYTSTIQPEIPVSEMETLRIQHQLREAMKTLSFKAEAAQIRVNRAMDRTQVILLAELPFESGKDETSATTALKALLPDEQVDMIVKLRLGHSEQMDREYRLSGGKHSADTPTASAFSKTAYPFLQDDCLERFGLERGEKIYKQAEERYKKFMEELDGCKTSAIRMHQGARLFPLMAYYQALLAGGVSIKDALFAVRVESQKVAEQKKTEAQRLTKMKGAYTFFRMFAKAHMKRSFPDEGFRVEWKCCNGREVAFDMTRCLYADTCAKHGCPELCAVFCENDDIAFSGYLPKIRFERSETIGTGAKKCDFHFVNIAQKSV